LTSCEIPKESRGRITRFVIDVDTDAVADYVMFDANDSSAPWPVAIISEMVDELSEWARREDMTARLLNRRTTEPMEERS
jgi:hypothetical protein